MDRFRSFPGKRTFTDLVRQVSRVPVSEGGCTRWPSGGVRRLESILRLTSLGRFGFVLLNDTERTIGRRLNPEIFKLFARPKLHNQPARLPPAARPSLGWLDGIPIFRNYLRVRSPRAACMVGGSKHPLAKPSQLLIKPSFFSGYLACQQRGDMLVKGPKFVHGHRFEITRFHFTNSDDFCLGRWPLYLGSRLRAYLGTSGPLRWSKKAKTESRSQVNPVFFKTRPKSDFPF